MSGTTTRWPAASLGATSCQSYPDEPSPCKSRTGEPAPSSSKYRDTPSRRNMGIADVTAPFQNNCDRSFSRVFVLSRWLSGGSNIQERTIVHQAFVKVHMRSFHRSRPGAAKAAL